jgi:AcrR family transcriptional regulator
VCDAARDEPRSRRARLRRERESRILDAAAKVIADKGYYQATVREIADLADVADGTIYNYFENKFDLLIGIMSRVAELERLPRELTEALETGAQSFFVAAFHDRMGRIRQGEEALKAILPQVFVHPDLREQFYRQYVVRIATRLEAYVQAQIEAGQIRPVDVPLTVRLVQSMFVGLLVLRILGDEVLRVAWDDVPEALAELVFDGLSARSRE